MSASESQDKIPNLKYSPGGAVKKNAYQFRHSESDSESDESETSSQPASVAADHGQRVTDSQGPPSSDAVPASLSVPVAVVGSVAPIGQRLQTPVKGRKNRKSSRSHRHDWQIMEGLKDGQRCEMMPEKYQGYLSKRKRWPMKGWHKRYFILDKGILYYCKSPSDMQKGKYHGVIDIGLSVLAYKKYRIDIDAEEQVYHIKVKSLFLEWLEKLRHHRLYRQHEIAYGTKESPRLTEITSPTEELPPLTASMNLPEKVRENSLQRHQSLVGQDRVATWLLDTQGFEHCSKGLSTGQSLLYQLNQDLEAIRNLPLASDNVFDDYLPEVELVDLEVTDRKKVKSFVGRSSKRKDHKRNASLQSPDIVSNHTQESSPLPTTQCNLNVPQPSFSSQPPTPQPQQSNSPPTYSTQEMMRASASNPNLNDMDEKRRPKSGPLPSSYKQRIDDIKLREGFLTKADKIHECLRSLLHSMSTERDRLKQAIEMNTVSTLNSSSSGATISSLKQTLGEVMTQNKTLKAKLSLIHKESSFTEMSPVVPGSPPGTPAERRIGGLTQSMSAESCSMSEYYDAVEENRQYSMSESSSERSDEEISSDISDEDTEHSVAISVSEENILANFQTGRRCKLPVPKPDVGDVSLWNLLFRNIGKDLTKISMPVTLNEPLSMLQRLGEELEYSELLEKANEYDDPFERMIYIAAFAVSSYASSCYRVGHKPFNPLLGETYECIREDKGWRLIAEQVSHHPPISACYCDSKSFIFWQDVQIKTKFWGKSMEIQPLGTVNVILPKFKDHYKWNKVTTCVHNILGGQRWVDQFGEMTITNGGVRCKLTFTKASHYYQSDKRHEVYGQILNADGKVVHNLFGRWNEALYVGHAPSVRCIWRPGAMPEDYELYYGFSRFAMELNETLAEESKMLPCTDSRFRPDQRLLEEGNITESEKEKLRIETVQRDRRKKRDSGKEEYRPMWFRKEMQGGKPHFVFDNKYWEARKEPGFVNMTLPKLW